MNYLVVPGCDLTIKCKLFSDSPRIALFESVGLHKNKR